MPSKRTDRRERARNRRLRQLVAAVAAVAVVALLTSVGYAISGAGRGDGVDARETTSSEADADLGARVASLSSTLSVEATEVAPAVEVPQLTGMSLAEARIMLEAAGLSIQLAEDPSLPEEGSGDQRAVSTQQPVAGQTVPVGTTVVLGVPVDGTASAKRKLPGAGYVVCIDPGHQERSDLSPEPIGPGATETKERVTGGTTGVSTKMPEYEVALQISMNLKSRLEAQGVKVVMTRTVNDVNISNSERAEVANKAGADLFVRVHGDGSTDSSVAGISTLYPANGRWTKGIASESKRAALAVHDAVRATTGAADRGMHARDDISGFNWSKVPAILVECGFMTNPVEDRLLASPHYQDKLAQGMTDGILGYLGEQ